MENFKKYVAEFIGTTILVVFGCGTAMAVGCDSGNGSGYLITALAFGLTIVAMAYSIGNVSGCHINPAVSLGVLISGKMSVKEFVGYIVSQFLGGIAGAAVLKCIWLWTGIEDKTSTLGSNGLTSGNIGASIVIEIVLTFVFVLAVLGVTSKDSFENVAGLVIGFALAFVHILGIALTGTSVNPARSLGPALLSGGESLGIVWVFILAPLVGGALAAIVYRALIATKNSRKER